MSLKYRSFEDDDPSIFEAELAMMDKDEADVKFDGHVHGCLGLGTSVFFCC